MKLFILALFSKLSPLLRDNEIFTIKQLITWFTPENYKDIDKGLRNSIFCARTSQAQGRVNYDN